MVVNLKWTTCRNQGANNVYTSHYKGLRLEISALNHNAFDYVTWELTVFRNGSGKCLLFKLPLSGAGQGKELAPRLMSDIQEALWE